MKKFIDSLFSNFESSLKINKKGWSSKKMTAFVVMILVIVAHISWIKHSYYKSDYTLLPEVLVIDYGIICVCLGMTTYEKIKITKNEQGQEQSDKSNTSNIN